MASSKFCDRVAFLKKKFLQQGWLYKGTAGCTTDSAGGSCGPYSPLWEIPSVSVRAALQMMTMAQNT
jgi:hypothetical protein